MRLTEQYFWHIIFSVFFLTLVILGAIILESEASEALHAATLFDMGIIALASFRLIRLFEHDKITAFFREQFWDAKEMKTKVMLVKPEGGPRLTIADLISCPWCLGIWMAALTTFCYFITPYAYYIILFLALSAVASMLQVTANLIGWSAEKFKHDVESR